VGLNGAWVHDWSRACGRRQVVVGRGRERGGRVGSRPMVGWEKIEGLSTGMDKERNRMKTFK